jgi:broad specificity phosphatase PhoE
VTRIYLVRHGQAGTREHYDALSGLGRRQSRLLGEYFAAQGITFAAAISGANARQQQTAAEVSAAYSQAGREFPPLTIDAGWNEFDLDHIYRELAPRLCAEDPHFQRDYDAMREQVRANRGIHEAEIHRRWTPCDFKVMEAWVGARFPYSGESWQDFRSRIAGRRAAIQDGNQRANIVVFTSATPTAIWAAMALNLDIDHTMQLAGALQNASFSILRLNGEALRLFSFNEAPHLPTPEHRSHR